MLLPVSNQTIVVKYILIVEFKTAWTETNIGLKFLLRKSDPWSFLIFLLFFMFLIMVSASPFFYRTWCICMSFVRASASGVRRRRNAEAKAGTWFICRVKLHLLHVTKTWLCFTEQCVQCMTYLRIKNN